MKVSELLILINLCFANPFRIFIFLCSQHRDLAYIKERPSEYVGFF